MSIYGVGIDVADVGRFESLLVQRGESFVRRWFTGAEIAECGTDPRHYAGRFAAKEAVWKALGLDSAGPAVWRSVEVVADRGRLQGTIVPPLSLPAGVTSVAVDVSLRGTCAVAVAIAVCDHDVA